MECWMKEFTLRPVHLKRGFYVMHFLMMTWTIPLRHPPELQKLYNNKKTLSERMERVFR